MTLYWTWLRTIQDNWGFIIVLSLFLVWTIGIILVTRLIVKREVLATEQERYPEKIKALLLDKDRQIRALSSQVSKQQETIEALKVRERSVKAWVAKIPEMLEGLK